MNLVNTEPISRWYPTDTATLLATNYITADLLVADEIGRRVKGELVELWVWRNTQGGNSVEEYNPYANISGRILDKHALPSCAGSVKAKYGYGLPGNLTDHWKGTAQDANVKASLPNSSPVTPSYDVFNINFTRIYAEIYLGYY